MNTVKHEPPRILVVGRSPSVVVATVDILRSKGYTADATNQFDHILADYDVADLDVLVFGGMVPPDTKQYLRDEISGRNPHVTFVQGLAGIAGLIAAQVDGAVADDAPDGDQVTYDAKQRSVRLTLTESDYVEVQAWWHTSFIPPEPKSTSLLVFEGQLETGSHSIPLPAEVPSEASFVTVAVGSAVHAFTVGAMPQSVMRLVPTGGVSDAPSSPEGSALPPVADVNTRADETPQEAP